MIADIRHLAADELRGRFTLSPDLAESARWIAERHRELGLEPVAADYTVPFPMVTGVRERAPSRLAVVRGGAARGLDAEIFQAAALSGSGTASGQAVFVGYAVKAPEVPGDKPDDPPLAPGYDDLEGVDLAGKIAVILLDAPNRPDLRTFFRRLQSEQEAFEAAFGPLRDAGDLDGIRALHAEVRGRLVKLLAPFLPGADLRDLWPLPADPEALKELKLDLQTLAGTLMREVAKLKGPRFDMRAGSLRAKLDRVIKAGAVGAVVVRGPRSFLSREDRTQDAFDDLSKARLADDEPLAIPVVHMKWREADKFIRIGSQKLSGIQAKIDRELTPYSRPLSVKLEVGADLETITTPIDNVLAKIPGTDLADELVIFGAHYDHIGQDDGVGDCSAATGPDGERDAICNGADDNASGTAMILELARAWQASGQRPRRTLIFAHFAGEELGLRGSQALAADPPFDLSKVAAMVNLDMVGRLGPRGLAIGGLHSSDAWMPLLDEIGAKGMSVLYEGSVATRSDHASFYRKGVPVLFFFTGTHADYHRPGDHADKINVDGLATIGAIVGEVSVAVADGLALPFRKPDKGDGLSGGLPGANPDTVVKRVKRSEAEAAE
ncbi:MAG: M20/M25/M40 family metallo-hydrolase [Nannocystaceae bacterium]